MDINKIGVIGHGLMGRGIIHLCALHNIEIIAVKRREDDQRLHDYFRREIKKGRLTQGKYKEMMQRIEITTDLSKVSNCQIIIECISEIAEAKKTLFKELDKICSPETILCSNTSSVIIGKLASVTNRPDRVIGLHYMSPVLVMKLVEVIKTIDTSEETVSIASNFIKKISKVPVVVNDFPGFVSSRLGASLVNEAAYILIQGVADAEAIDTIAKLGLNLPIGPLRLADEVGLDITLNVLDNLYHNYKDSKYSACPLIRVLVESGYLGKKNGKGFYSY